MSFLLQNESFTPPPFFISLKEQNRVQFLRVKFKVRIGTFCHPQPFRPSYPTSLLHQPSSLSCCLLPATASAITIMVTEGGSGNGTDPAIPLKECDASGPPRTQAYGIPPMCSFSKESSKRKEHLEK